MIKRNMGQLFELSILVLAAFALLDAWVQGVLLPLLGIILLCAFILLVVLNTSLYVWNWVKDRE